MGSGTDAGGHKPGYIVLIAVMVFFFVLMLFFNGMASGTIIPGLFINSTGDVSDIFYLEITPAGWTFSIWGFIYAYQVIFIAYILSTLCRRTPKGYLYYTPAFLPPIIYIVYIFNNCLNVAWLLLWDRQLIGYSLIIIALTPVTLYICIGASMYSLHKYAPDLIEEGNPREPHLVIGIIHNGLGMYAAWVTIATLLNGGAVLTYLLGVPQPIASSIALCVLAFDLVLYIFVDFVVFEKHFRHLYTPYLVLHFALIGSLSKNFNAQANNTVFTIGLIGIGSMVLVMKIIYSIYMSKKKPLFERHGGYSSKVSP